ncbi:MAG: hypothetical protein LQ352_008220 [Teloschistes flavicans]|nr:MAG: hypothetical protein LQ352_008220 [Teloschistes flavicans]
MPRRKPPPPEHAVAQSLLFRLSPEIRNMIYAQVLVNSDSHASMFIRRSSKRRKDNRLQVDIQELQSMEIRGHNLPSISTTILRSCRLIHAESQPFLYRANAFHFDSPHTLHSFRRQTAKHPSVRIQELSLQLGPSDNYHIRTAWERYISAPSEGKKKCLQNDYPHLKRLTIELTGLYKFHGTKHLQKLLESFAQAIAGLDWVHIIGLNDEAIISDLKPMVCTAQPSSSDDKHASSLAREIESVQSHLTEFDRAVGWKNVTLWQDLAHDLFSRRIAWLQEQNVRLLRMAEDQVEHVPEGVELEKHRKRARVDSLAKEIQARISFLTQGPRLGSNATNLTANPRNNHALADYQMQLMLLEQQNRMRQAQAGAQAGAVVPAQPGNNEWHIQALQAELQSLDRL